MVIFQLFRRGRAQRNYCDKLPVVLVLAKDYDRANLDHLRDFVAPEVAHQNGSFLGLIL